MNISLALLASNLVLYATVFLGVATVSYLLGCFNGAIVFSKYILRDDVRNHGSGNAGLTNFHRTFGGGLTFAVIASDMLKGVFAVLLGRVVFTYLGNPLFGMYYAALFAIVGHMFPVMFGFKGGKGILTGGAIAIALDWRLALLVWGAFLLLAVLTKYVSLGSVVAGVLLPVGTWLFGWPRGCVILAIVMGGLMVWQHRGNIQRLLAGTEPKFSLHRKKEDAT